MTVQKLRSLILIFSFRTKNNKEDLKKAEAEADTEQHEYDTILLSLDEEEDDVKESAPEKQ